MKIIFKKRKRCLQEAVATDYFQPIRDKYRAMAGARKYHPNAPPEVVQTLSQMSVSENGRSKIRGSEGVISKVYDDLRGGRPIDKLRRSQTKGTPTIGIGHAIFDANPIWRPYLKSGPASLSTAEAEELFSYDLASHANRFIKKLTRVPTQNQFDAMLYYTYNTGTLHNRIVKPFNRGDFKAAAHAIRTGPTSSRGKQLKGLVRRRKKEAALFSKPDTPGQAMAGAAAVQAPPARGKRYVIISGNSHASAAYPRIRDQYKRLEKQTGIDYVIKRIDAPQGRGGEIRTQLSRIKRLANELKGKNAQIAAIIHTGTVLQGRPESEGKPATGDYKRMNELINEYTSLTRNVIFIGSPTARSGFKGHGSRVQWNDWLKKSLPGHGIKYIETAGLTGDEDLKDNVHLSKKGYDKIMSAALPAISFDDSGKLPTMAAGPAAAGMPQPTEMSGGVFVHGISPIEKFKFDVFYNELVMYFGPSAIDKMLPTHGKDYKFGREHQEAYDDLQKAKKTPAAVDARVAGPTSAAGAIPVAQSEEESPGVCPEGQVAMEDGYCYEFVQSAEDLEKGFLGTERYGVDERDPLKRGQPKQLKDYTRRLTESRGKRKIKIKVLTRDQTI
jgi:GH24 family phage-related lysozyme (muramidase)